MQWCDYAFTVIEEADGSFDAEHQWFDTYAFRLNSEPMTSSS
ncbi:hypothetical protein [Natrialba chahannaoensis]|nr:hypothetical protein [Natrialba chahannaoensis]